MNTMEYNTDQDDEEVGPELPAQFEWLKSNLNDTSDRKFLLMSHIYAGARVKHDNSY